MAEKGAEEATSDEQSSRSPESFVRRRRLFPGRGKKGRWADEEKRLLQKPVLVAVAVLTALFLLLAVLGRRSLLAGTPASSSSSVEKKSATTRAAFFEHEIRVMPRRMEKMLQPDANNGSSKLPPLQTFQVDVPLLGPNGSVVGAGTPDGFEGIPTATAGNGMGCEVTLAVNVFASSFGKPFVGDYTPPACVGDSNTVVMNLTVSSQGRQFDRLSIVYLGDTEIFRTSTEEPRLRGISYTYMTDVSKYMALWKQPQKVIFDLPNIIDENATPPLNGTYNTTLTAYFFSAPMALTPADTIIPISARLSNTSQASVFTIPNPDASASTVVTDFPRNAARAVFSVSATGQADEEFWWSNVLQSAVTTYNASDPGQSNVLFGYSPFREVQVRIDGQLAGVQWPFPVIFTGGVSPALWTPMVGLDAFELKEGEIDISPWLGVLCDGQPHNFSMHVVGLDDDGQGTSARLSAGVGNNWQLTGKVFVWLDDTPGAVTTGTPPTLSGADAPNIAVSQSLTQNATGFNDTLHYTTSVTRQLSVAGSITTARGGTQAVAWTQTLSHTDDGTLANGGANQFVATTTEGTDTSTRGGEGGGSGAASWSVTYSYPLNANLSSTVLANNGTTRFVTILERTKSMNRSASGSGQQQQQQQGLVSPSGLQLFAALPATADLTSRAAGTSWTATQRGEAVLLLAAGGGPGSSSLATQTERVRLGAATTAGMLGDEKDGELYFREVSVDSTGRVVNDTERLAGESVVGRRPPATGLV